MNQPRLREDEIGRKLDEAHQSGELRSAPSYGKPLVEDTGWAQTPDELRLGFKILKDAGVAPPEVELFNQRAKLREALEAATADTEKQAIRRALSDIEQKISIRLESMRSSGS